MMRSLFAIALIMVVFQSNAQKAEGWVKIYTDDFMTNTGEWYTTEATNNLSRVSSQNHRLVLHLFDQGTKRATDYTYVDFNKDFILKAEIGATGSAKLNKRDRSDFGLLFGYSSHRYEALQGGYGFLLNFYQKGIRVYARDENGKTLYDEILRENDYTPSDYTTIGVKKEGKKIKFYLNNELVFSEKAVNTAGGAISFVAFRKMKAFMREISVFEKATELKHATEILSYEQEKKLDSILSGISFKKGSPMLSFRSEGHINELISLLSDKEDFNIEINAHTNDQGDAEQLTLLSEARAQNLKDLLVSKGINETNITTKGSGDLYPVTDDFTFQGSQKNERIEITLIPIPPSVDIDVSESSSQ